jgi:hypothetical protein
VTPQTVSLTTNPVVAMTPELQMIGALATRLLLTGHPGRKMFLRMDEVETICGIRIDRQQVGGVDGYVIMPKSYGEVFKENPE